MFRFLRSVVFLAVAVAIALWAGRLYLNQKALVEAENRATHRLDSGEFGAAKAQFEKLLLAVPEADTVRRQRLHAKIAACYVALADDTSLSLDETLVLYREALQHDPKAGVPANIRKLMDSRAAPR